MPKTLAAELPENEEILSEASSLPLGYEKKAVVVDNASFLQKDGDKEVKIKAK